MVLFNAYDDWLRSISRAICRLLCRALWQLCLSSTRWQLLLLALHELWEREGRFSSDAGELGLDLPSLDHAVDPSVQCTESSFQILATLPRAIEEKEDVEGRVRRFSVNEEGRIKQRWIADKI